jgi:uncharacterized protein YlxW (UPF0749 family)
MLLIRSKKKWRREVGKVAGAVAVAGKSIEITINNEEAIGEKKESKYLKPHQFCLRRQPQWINLLQLQRKWKWQVTLKSILEVAGGRTHQFSLSSQSLKPPRNKRNKRKKCYRCKRSKLMQNQINKKGRRVKRLHEEVVIEDEAEIISREVQLLRKKGALIINGR